MMTTVLMMICLAAAQAAGDVQAEGGSGDATTAAEPAAAGVVDAADVAGDVPAAAPAQAAGEVAAAGATSAGGAQATGSTAAAAAFAPGSPAESPVADEPTPLEDAAVLQAQALLAESAGQIARAVELLRRAREASPTDAEVAFDLARVALLAVGPYELPAASDLDGLLTLEPASAEARMLRAYVLGRRGEQETAQVELAGAERLDPGNPDLLGMRAWLTADVEPPRFALRVGVRSQYDTNVTVAPTDSPSGMAGVRLVADVDATVVPLASVSWLSVRGLVRYGAHLSKRRQLGDYDVGAASLEVRAAGSVGPVQLDASVWGSDVMVEGVLEQFMQEGAAAANAAIGLGAWRPGLFAAGGARNFHDEQQEGGALDRDGPFAEAGGFVEWSGPRLMLLARAGFQTEIGQGAEQRERGATATLLGRLGVHDLRLTAAVAYELRDYYDTVDRVDHRLTPTAMASFPLDETFKAVAGYAWVRNFSSAALDYDRHILQLGIEGGW